MDSIQCLQLKLCGESNVDEYCLLCLRHPRKGCGHISHKASHRSCSDVLYIRHEFAKQYLHTVNFILSCACMMPQTESTSISVLSEVQIIQNLNIVRCVIVHIFCLFVFLEIKQIFKNEVLNLNTQSEKQSCQVVSLVFS